MFEQLRTKKFVNREHTGEYAEIEFDTYVDNRGKEEVDEIRTNLHYYEAGSGIPLILVHGIGQSSYTWRKNFEELSEYFHVYAIDLPGHGFSGKAPMRYTIEEMALAIEAFMNVANIEAAHFCAFGEGCGYVVDFAAHNPQRVKKLVLISPVVSNGRRGINSVFAMAASKMMFSEPVMHTLLEDCYFDRTLVKEEEAAEYFIPYEDKEFRQIAKACMMNFFDDEIPNAIYKIKSPILVIVGADDKMNGGKNNPFLSYSFASASSLTVRNCGFIVQEEKPEKVNEALIRFCAK